MTTPGFQRHQMILGFFWSKWKKILIAASFFMLINLNIRQCSNIKEVVVDHGSSFEILSRFNLLKNNDLEKFKCRHANVKRLK